MTPRVAVVVALGVFVVLGALSTALFLAAFQFRVDWFAEPAGIVSGGAGAAILFKWAALADLFSYYLPTGVIAVALFTVLRRGSEVLALVGLVAALGYVLAGGAGAATLALAGSPLIEAYADGGENRGAIAVAFSTLIDVVFRAVWQLLDGVLLATWLTSVGLLVRPFQPALGRVSLLLAVVVAAGVAFNVLGLGLARDVSLGVVFVVWAAWAIWLGRLVWRRESPFEALDRPAAGS